jgi:hypothetical protein
MSLVYAIHKVHYRKAGAAEDTVVQPGTVFELPVKADEAILVRNGSVREPTEQEVSLYELANGTRLVRAASAPAPTHEAPDPMLGPAA